MNGSTERFDLQYVAVEGVIGAGKSTLAGALAPRLEARLLLEEFQENPFLADFYREQARFAFQTQLFFLLSRFRQQQELARPELAGRCVVSDYTFEKDRVFAALTLTEPELRLYDAVHAVLEPQVPSPDRIIFLRSSIERLQRNIRSRGREMERAIDAEYLARLSSEYERVLLGRPAARTIVVDADRYDFANDPRLVEQLAADLLRPCEPGVRTFQPE